ncbi:M15 family metallopeptidase [Methylophilus aquaticus]|uniref:M15 family metallopeptidase n=1 Tax=Methylophilus aquaticus TaxID=1971610 RepID=A0ABT9JUL8_9PROT|nr:M15 family metallopeptidase [Methylophilus aquaticus]MDP8568290.1 M15 family metallopeptidase [Methylophilus aquaticus]
MSFKLFTSDILFFQRVLRAEGLYLGKLDGDWGPKTEKAVNQFLEKSDQIKHQFGMFDVRTEACIATLATLAQQQARICIRHMLDRGLIARIISGTRTYEEQNILYRKGRFSNPGPRVTNARGGESNHNFGVAWDIGLFTATGGYLADGIQYTQAGQAGKSAQTEWGGEWTKFVDKPHYQLRLPLPVSELRKRFEEGSLHYQDLLRR